MLTYQLKYKQTIGKKIKLNEFPVIRHNLILLVSGE